MRTIYIDTDFKCHIDGNDDMTPVVTNFFDGKCDAFVEGYRFVPTGKTWIRSDGFEFQGEMAAPWKDYKELDRVQRAYERQLLAEYETLINELYSEVAAE